MDVSDVIAFIRDYARIGQELAAIRADLADIKKEQKIMATGLDNLQAADSALQAEVVQILTDIQTALTNDDPDAAVQAAADIVNKAVSDLQAGDPVQPPPPPPAT